jgi:biopolymer transport protein ExbD
MSLSQRARRAAQHERRRSEVELNLIPLIDIMSVMVSFLLVYSADVEAIQTSKGVEIPQSIAADKPRDSVVVMITKDNLFVQGEVVATIDEIRAAKTPLIDPLSQVLRRPLLWNDVAHGLEGREITVIADKSLTYDVVRKVMSTCTSEGYGHISLAVIEKDSSSST